jgi:hypothetical protein
VLRKKSKYTDYFFRIGIVTDSLEKGYYFTDRNVYLLKYIKDVISKGISIGDSHFSYLNYSNSQLKNHSLWMVCD